MTTRRGTVLSLLREYERQGAIVERCRNGWQVYLDGRCVATLHASPSRTAISYAKRDVERAFRDRPGPLSSDTVGQPSATPSSRTTRSVPRIQSSIVTPPPQPSTTNHEGDIIMPAKPPTRPPIVIGIEEGLDIPRWHFAIRSIGPEEAQRILDVQSPNRHTYSLLVDRYATDMDSGRWQLTPETVIIDHKGGVLDGQHRLRAVIKTKVARPFLVVSDVDPALIGVLGIGRSRSSADILMLEGKERSGRLAPALNVLHSYLTIPDSRSWDGKNTGTLTGPGMLELANKHPGLDDCVTHGRNVATKLGLSPSAITVGIYLTTYEMPIKEQEEGWFHPLESGVGLEEGSAILTLRNLSGRRGEGKRRPKQGNELQGYCLRAYLCAWKAWRENRPTPKPFPPVRMPEVGLPTRKSPPERPTRPKRGQ